MRLKSVNVSIPYLITGAASLAAGLFLAAHHPLSPILSLIGCLGAAILCARVAHAWLVLLPALLPVVDLAPWSGWLSFEEFDILVLGAAAGAHLQQARAVPGTASRPSVLLLLLGGGLLLSVGISLVRGVVDAGGIQFGWFQGYEGPMNSLRLAKPFLLAALFAPLMKPAVLRPGSPGSAYLAWGMALGLGLASLAAIWERVAFPGLLNFSADYRTTALFWEMHVGGAALDGFLALTMPFALWLVVRAHGVRQLASVAVLIALGSYASLTTFSRGVYGALAVAVVVLAVLAWRQAGEAPRAGPGAPPGSPWRIAGTLLGTAVAAGAAFWVFRHGGYRGLAAVFGVLAMVMATGGLARSASPGQRWAALVAGMLAGGAAVGMALVVGKGAYLAYGVLFVLTLAAVAWARKSGGGPLLPLAGGVALAITAAQVAGHWGGSAALMDAIAVLSVIGGLALWNALAARPVWPVALRGQAVLLVGVAALAALVAVLGGGAYMGGRFANTEGDLRGRLKHWSEGLALLQTPADWLVGKGLGRFPETFFFGAPGNEFPGSYQLRQEAGNTFLALSGPRYQIGYGEVLRVSQRMSLVPGPYRLEFDVRSEREARMNVGLCEKHLLYHEACARLTVRIPPRGESAWEHMVVPLDASHMDGGSWYAPQLIAFSLALETLGARVDVDNVSLVDVRGQQALANGDFTDEMQRWFITSDRHHLPWHMKSMFLHVLFEQGLAGLALFAMLVIAALARLAIGRNRRLSLAPPLAAAMAGFLVVGLFDSLLDIPRVAFLFFLLLVLAIQSSRRPEA